MRPGAPHESAVDIEQNQPAIAHKPMLTRVAGLTKLQRAVHAPRGQFRLSRRFPLASFPNEFSHAGCRNGSNPLKT